MSDNDEVGGRISTVSVVMHGSYRRFHGTSFSAHADMDDALTEAKELSEIGGEAVVVEMRVFAHYRNGSAVRDREGTESDV